MANNQTRKNLGLLFGVLLLDLLSFTCILPLFPILMDYYATNDSSNWFYSKITSLLAIFEGWIGVPNVPRYNSVFFGGLLGSLYSFLQCLACPIVGSVSDIYGRKPMFLISAFGSLLSYILWANAETFTIFLISRIIGGISKTSVSIATMMATDLSNQEKRIKGVVIVGLCFSIGFLVGPMFGAYFAAQGRKAALGEAFFTTPAYFAIGLTVLEIIGLVFLIPETLHSQQVTSEKNPTANEIILNPFHSMRLSGVQTKSAKEGMNLRVLGRCYFMHVLIYSGLEFVLTFLTHSRFQYTSMDQGKMFLLIGFVMIIIQGGVTRRIPLSRQKTYASMGFIISMVGFVLIGCLTSKVGFFIGIIFHSAASGMLVPSLTTIASCMGSDSEKGKVLGVFRSLGYLARAIGPFLAASAFWIFGPTLTYAIGGILLCIPLLILRMVENPSTISASSVPPQMNLSAYHQNGNMKHYTLPDKVT